MPTPIGHSLAGVAIRLVAPKPLVRANWPLALLVVGLANLPDIDFLPGYLRGGDPRAYHWGPTHSITAALLVGAVVGTIARWRTGRFVPAFTLATAAYGSHVLLDLLLGPAAGFDIGIQVFWPFSPERFMLPWHVFLMFPAEIAQIGPINALFSRGILPVITRELLILIPLVLATAALRLWRKQNDSK